MTGPFMLETLDIIEQAGFEPRIQDISRATPAPKINTEDCLIDWQAHDQQVHNHIRAFSEKPGAYCFLDEMKIKILGSLRESHENLPDLDPGDIFIDNKQLFVGTGARPVLVTRLQPEGKKAMDALSFINGYHIQTHRQFSSTRKEVIN
jgi:methionyl-tRNA formyltransferase